MSGWGPTEYPSPHLSATRSDQRLSPERCTRFVVRHTREGALSLDGEVPEFLGRLVLFQKADDSVGQPQASQVSRYDRAVLPRFPGELADASRARLFHLDAMSTRFLHRRSLLPLVEHFQIALRHHLPRLVQSREGDSLAT